MKKILLVVFVIALAACNQSEKSDAYGNFEAREVMVSSQGNGQLLRFEVEEGDLIKKGAEVGIVDTLDLHLSLVQLQNQEKVLDARLESINAQLQVNKQQIRNLEVEKQRVENLHREGAATQKQIDDVQGKYDLLLVQLESVRVQKSSVEAERLSLIARQDQLSESLRKCRIINPTEGTVLTRYSRQGEVVSYGKPLYKIGNLSYLELKVFVSGSQLPYIVIGQEVEVLIDRSPKENKSMSGIVSWISPQAEFTPKTIQTKEERVNLVYAVKVKVKNDGELKIGMPGEVNFRLNSSN